MTEEAASKPYENHPLIPKQTTSQNKLSEKSRDDPYGAAYLFKYIILAQVCVYMEAGAVPALLGQFTMTFGLNPAQQGLLGAVVYIALSLAAPVCAYAFKRYNARIVLGGSLIVNSVAVLLFTFTPINLEYSTALLIFFRGIIGYTQAFLSVYSPLWVHEYAPRDKRTIWMSYLQGATPLGITFGYLVGSIAIWCSQTPSGCYWMLCWRFPFLFAFLTVLPLGFLTFLIPDEHIRTQRMLRRQSLVLLDSDEENALDCDEGSLAPSESEASVSKHDHLTEFQGICLLLKTPVYVGVVLALSALFFVVTGVQYWVTLFLSTNTNNSAYTIHCAYLIVAGSGPIVGVFFGGWLIDYYGGYSGPENEARSILICLLLGGIGGLAGIPITFFHSTWYIAIFLWIMLFCGGSILPPSSGIVIASVDRSLRPLASSVANTSYNLLGYAASNYLPGLIMKSLIPEDQHVADSYLYRMGFRIVLGWSAVSFVFMSGAYYFSRRKALASRN